MPKTPAPPVERKKYVKDVTPLVIVETALQYIDTYGWVKHESGSKQKGFCMSGALVEAYRDLKPERYKYGTSAILADASEKAYRVVENCIPGASPTIPHYNDHSRTTKAKVRALLQCAIDTLRSKKANGKARVQ